MRKMLVLQSPVLWLVVAAVAIAAVLLVVRGRKPADWGFKDVVKNPDYWEDSRQAREQVDAAAEAAKGWSEEEVASFAKRYVLEAKSSRDAWDEALILRVLAERTHPTLLLLLGDPALYYRLVKPTGVDLLPEAPFNRACDLLGDSPPVTAVEVLSPFLNDPSDRIREDAALSMAKIGAAAITPHVRKALADPDKDVATYALMGLEFALERSGLDQSAATALFPDVLALLRAGKNADHATGVLFRLDQAKAMDFFLSPDVLTAKSPIVHEVLEALAAAKVSLPRDRLLALIADLESMEMKYPRTYALSEALRLLGQLKREDDRDFLSARTSHPETEVAQGAAAGLLCSFGLDGFEQRISDKENQTGYESLSELQRFYSAVFMCDAEINNGGLAQYFVNSSGDQWKDAVAGLKAMGFNERLTIVNEAIAKFGNQGPSTDRNVRQDQLSKLFNRNDSIFDALDSRYFKSPEVTEVLATRFVLAHPDGFR